MNPRNILNLLLVVCCLTVFSTVAWAQSWPQWGQNQQHTGSLPLAGQSLTHKLADIIYDPFVPDEQAFTGGELLALDIAYFCAWLWERLIRHSLLARMGSFTPPMAATCS